MEDVPEVPRAASGFVGAGTVGAVLIGRIVFSGRAIDSSLGFMSTFVGVAAEDVR